MMHTEQDTTRVERYIAAHRAQVAAIAWAVLTALAIVAWALILPVLGIISANLVAASAVVIALGMAIAALAWYWGEA